MATDDRPIRCRVFREGRSWWLVVPEAALFDRERGTYHRRTFREIVQLLDFYLWRVRRPRELRKD